jgi:hypothetical protein
MKVTIELGALAPDLFKQLKHFKLEHKVVKQFQNDADAITRLSINGYLSHGVVEQARKGLVRKIQKQINEIQAKVRTEVSNA